MDTQPVDIMEAAGVKPTSNRIIVLRALLAAHSPLSLLELESQLRTLDRSSIFRVLTLLQEHEVIHSVEDGRGVTKYELCHGHHHCTPDDMHVHFYCEVCDKVFCFDDVNVPQVDVPDGFKVRSVNYMLKGVCPSCRSKTDTETLNKS